MTSDTLHGAKRAAMLFTLAAFLSACYEWAPPPGPIEDVTASGDETVRVWTTDGDQVTLRQARVEGDLLLGRNGSRRDTIPLADVDHFLVERHDTTRDVIVIVIPLALAAGLLIALSSAYGGN